MNSLTAALITIRRNPYQTLVSILMMAFTFFVGYRFALLAIGTEYTLRYFETRPEIIAFFELDATSEDIADLESKMLEKDYVKNVELVDQAEALKIYQTENQDEPLLLELVTADIFPASIEISGQDIESLDVIKEDLQANELIDEVVYQKDVIDSLTNWTTAIRQEGIQNTIILSLVAFFVITTVIGLSVSSKRHMIKIMRLIGATGWYVRVPFIWEGMLYALTGSLLGWGGVYVHLLYTTPQLKSVLGEIVPLPIPLETMGLLLVAGTTVGLIFGGLAGSLAVGRFVKK